MRLWKIWRDVALLRLRNKEMAIANYEREKELRMMWQRIATQPTLRDIYEAMVVTDD